MIGLGWFLVGCVLLCAWLFGHRVARLLVSRPFLALLPFGLLGLFLVCHAAEAKGRLIGFGMLVGVTGARPIASLLMWGRSAQRRAS